MEGEKGRDNILEDRSWVSLLCRRTYVIQFVGCTRILSLFSTLHNHDLILNPDTTLDWLTFGGGGTWEHGNTDSGDSSSGRTRYFFMDTQDQGCFFSSYTFVYIFLLFTRTLRLLKLKSAFTYGQFSRTNGYFDWTGVWIWVQGHARTR